MVNKKRVLFSTAFLFLLPLSAAQSGNQFFQLFSGYVGVPITNGQQFILRVLAPFIFVFAITRFVANGAFKNALDNSGLGGEVGKRAPTLVGIAVAGITMIMFGSVMLWVILIFAILGVLWFAATSLGYVGRSTGATGLAKSAASKVGSSSSSSSSGGVSPEKVGNMLDERIGQLKSELSSIDDEEQDEKQKEDQTEQEEEEGANPDQVEDEIESEEAELMDIVQKLETVEGQLADFESDIAQIEDQEISQAQAEDEDLGNIEDFGYRFNEYLTNTIQRAKQGKISEDEMEEMRNRFNTEVKFLRQLESDLDREREIHEVTEEAIQGLKELQQEIEPHFESEIHRAESLVEELEDEEQKAEALSQKYGAREIFEEIEQDESETADIEAEIKNQVVQKMQELEDQLDEEIQRAKQLRNYDQQEFNEIIEVVQNLDTEESRLNKMKGMFGNDPQFQEEIDEIIRLIEDIEEMTQQLSSEHQA